MESSDLKVLPSFIRRLLEKQESEGTFDVEEDESCDSENISLRAEANFIIFRKFEDKNVLFPKPQIVSPPEKDIPGLFNETPLNPEKLVIFKNDEKNIFLKESENVSLLDISKQRNHIEASLVQDNLEKAPSDDKSFICFTYFDKDLNCNTSKEPSYCIIEEKFVGYPPRNRNEVKKLLELSESHSNSNSLIYVPRRPRVKKSVKKKLSPREYLKTRTQIYEKITFFHRTGVIVWIPISNFRIELVHSLVRKFGDIVMIHDRWIRSDTSSKSRSPEDSWGGVLVIYATLEEAETAKAEIPNMHRFMKTLGLSELLHCLVSAELEHFEKVKTNIFVNVPGQNNDENRHQLNVLLETFGQVIPEDCYQVIGQNSIRITTAYTCASYAFLAMTVLDGLPFGTSKLKVEVCETEKERAILKDLSFHLRDFIGTSAFLFNGVN